MTDPPPEENRRRALGSLSGYLTGQDWLSDLVPHLAFGAATVCVYEALSRRSC